MLRHLGTAAVLFGLWAGLAAPAARAITEIELGKQLFFDRRLSKTEQISCNSCHNLSGNGTDSRSTSVGIRDQVGKRNAPTVWNVATMRALFWDGRASSLEQQALFPLLNPVEMGMPSFDAIVRRLSMIRGYVAEFSEVYPGSGITMENVVRAIAAFERTLVTAPSKAVLGRIKPYSGAFVSVGCARCHTEGPGAPPAAAVFTKFPVYLTTKAAANHLADDPGRYAVTNDPDDMNVWRVPSLRNVALTAPYFHNGSVRDLPEAVRVMAETELGKSISEREVREIVQFLMIYTEKITPVVPPHMPED